ncbi:hypothetical protein M427DRAFT_34948 [Gonapodya prolifera JEL478]|uniref:Uncharacterized protein n=1 Tax=Gonapodya prolifera (strain JEL478) TaxID=1344416 RepID=A0A139A6E0_GONPJ|nr:hypothetical protein M427DRAFT_34948 [Gonapodya prolifera JEL478]|eukprot:KXS12219.1 hypothetical protein M427DRAFT_34948 [Gonapodya prolifera JEL478]
MRTRCLGGDPTEPVAAGQSALLASPPVDERTANRWRNEPEHIVNVESSIDNNEEARGASASGDNLTKPKLAKDETQMPLAVRRTFVLGIFLSTLQILFAMALFCAIIVALTRSEKRAKTSGGTTAVVTERDTVLKLYTLAYLFTQMFEFWMYLSSVTTANQAELLGHFFRMLVNWILRGGAEYGGRCGVGLLLKIDVLFLVLVLLYFIFLGVVPQLFFVMATDVFFVVFYLDGTWLLYSLGNSAIAARSVANVTVFCICSGVVFLNNVLCLYSLLTGSVRSNPAPWERKVQYVMLVSDELNVHAKTAPPATNATHPRPTIQAARPSSLWS